jgi:aconitase B
VLVLEDEVGVGSVNANLGHYRAAAQALAGADARSLHRLITRRVPLTDFAEALHPSRDGVEVVLTLHG